MDAAFQPCLTTVRYSDTGRALAAAATPPGVTSTELNRTLDEAFDAIVKDKLTTQDEKDIAALGRSMGAWYNDRVPMAAAKSIIMAVISGQTPGAISHVMADAVVNAISHVGNFPGLKHDILEQGFKHIAKHPDVSPDERSLCELGKSINLAGLHERAPSVAGALVVMRAVGADHKDQHMGILLASTTLDAAQATAGDGRKRRVLGEGFEAVRESPKASATQKSLARMGSRLGHWYSDATQVRAARQKVMEQIATQAAAANQAPTPTA
jgi:hypothetical protein